MNIHDAQNARRAHARLPRGLMAGIAAVILLAGCASTTPAWDAVFGDTVRAAAAQQTLNPDASRNTDPVAGVDGRAAREAINRYQKSFVEKEPQPNVFTIGISGN